MPSLGFRHSLIICTHLPEPGKGGLPPGALGWARPCSSGEAWRRCSPCCPDPTCGGRPEPACVGETRSAVAALCLRPLPLPLTRGRKERCVHQPGHQEATRAHEETLQSTHRPTPHLSSASSSPLRPPTTRPEPAHEDQAKPWRPPPSEKPHPSMFCLQGEESTPRDKHPKRRLPFTHSS